MVNDNILKDLGLVDGTPSLTPRQVEEIGTLLPEKETVRVLEFGAGRSTKLIFDALKKKYKEVVYVTYETNPKYVPTEEGITVRMHTREDLVNSQITIPSHEKYDLVIIDGPDGDLRKHWFFLFKDNVQKSTIIHIDDAFHYPSFELEFRNNFPNTEDMFIVPLGSYKGNKCWITSKIL